MKERNKKILASIKKFFKETPSEEIQKILKEIEERDYSNCPTLEDIEKERMIFDITKENKILKRALDNSFCYERIGCIRGCRKRKYCKSDWRKCVRAAITEARKEIIKEENNK